MEAGDIEAYRHVQRIAKKTLEHMTRYIKAGMTEQSIAAECERYMRVNHSVQSFWYHGVPALVLVGERTQLSVSGKSYKPTQTCVRETDLVTIDVSPEIAGYWGDHARSFIVVDGVVTNAFTSRLAADVSTLVEGIEVEQQLHKSLRTKACSDMTFGELHGEMNGVLHALGYSNLDFRGNFGHSIEREIDARRYIEPENGMRLDAVSLFTFEPHIRKEPGGTFGFKREDIYYFAGGKLLLL